MVGEREARGVCRREPANGGNSQPVGSASPESLVILGGGIGEGEARVSGSGSKGGKKKKGAGLYGGVGMLMPTESDDAEPGQSGSLPLISSSPGHHKVVVCARMHVCMCVCVCV